LTKERERDRRIYTNLIHDNSLIPFLLSFSCTAEWIFGKKLVIRLKKINMLFSKEVHDDPVYFLNLTISKKIIKKLKNTMINL